MIGLGVRNSEFLTEIFFFRIAFFKFILVLIIKPFAKFLVF